jgi:hypothetical protein
MSTKLGLLYQLVWASFQGWKINTRKNLVYFDFMFVIINAAYSLQSSSLQPIVMLNLLCHHSHKHL